MATALTPATMVRNGTVTFSPTAFTSTTTVQYTFNQVVDENFFIYMELTSTAADHLKLTVYAAGSTDNSSTVTWREGIGNYTNTLTSTAKTTPYRALYGPFQSAIYLGSTGNIFLELSTTTNAQGTGYVGVAKMPYI